MRERDITFIDLCAGLGGFHLALDRAAEKASKPWSFRCLLAADIQPELRRVYVENFPSVVPTYAEYYPPERCREVEGLADLYDGEGNLEHVHGDLSYLVDTEEDCLRTWPGSEQPIIPPHDLLCAGFPCQPFSKSGAQLGFDELNGTVFRMLAIIIREHQPRYVFLENVGNFERHDNGNTWKVVREKLEEFGYSFRATTTVSGDDGGLGLLSPHHLGLPQHRERFFIVAQHERTVAAFHPHRYPFPLSYRSAENPQEKAAELDAKSTADLRRIIDESAAVAPLDHLAKAEISPRRVEVVDHWCRLLEQIEHHDQQCPDSEKIRPLPSFPIWGYELDLWNDYPYIENPKPLIGNRQALATHRLRVLSKIEQRGLMEYGPRGERSYLSDYDSVSSSTERWTDSWPGYAGKRDTWPRWKQRFIQQNREWGSLLWSKLEPSWLRGWLDDLLAMPPSHQKLEWNSQGEDVNLWKHILQFRPSGLRVKRFRHIPALVAMTTTQIPIVPVPDRECYPPARHLVPGEALALQGFPRGWRMPATKGGTFTALGNAVHVDLVAEIILSWLFEENGRYGKDGRPVEHPRPGQMALGIEHVDHESREEAD